MTYDILGNVMSATTPNLDQTSFSYDNLNRLTSTLYPDATSVVSTYDFFGNATSLLDNEGATTMFAYDNGEQLSTITDSLNKVTTFVYDTEGRVTLKTDRKNDALVFGYTLTGDLEKVTYPDATMVDFTYDLSSNLKSINEVAGTTTYMYDTLNRLTNLNDVHGFDIGYEYNDVGSVTKVIYPGVGKEVIYTYDELNRIKTVTAWMGDVATYNYDSAGHLVSVNNFNGIKSSFKYDKADRVIAIKNQRTDSSILTSYDYTLDGNGNKTKVAKNEPHALTLPLSETAFTYNVEKNRLLTAGASTFLYDNEGQLSNKDSDTFTFDFDHRLTAIGGASNSQFMYDARDARVKAVRGGVETKYIYDAGGNLLAEADSAGVIQRYYIYGAGLLAAITPTGDVYTYHYNGNGNTIAITDQTQTVVNSYAYTPYGQITTEVENITNPFKFAGQFGIMSEGSDIYYMRSRYYDASVGRFISEDPSGFVDGPNLYLYALGNPISFVDPLGLSAERANLVDLFQTGLDLAGLIPGIGEPFDLANASIYSLRGDYVNAGLSGAAAIPFIGWGATVGKFVNKNAILASKLGNKALGQTGKKAATLLKRMANKAGLDVVPGGKHLKVIDKTGRLVTTIPHSPKGAGTVKGIVNDILNAAN